MAKKINHQEIIKHYNNGLSIKQIKNMGLASEPTISKILKQNNIPIRKDNGCSLKLPADEINKLYQKGLSTYELANKYNCSDETIRKLIKFPRSYKESNLNKPKHVNQKISDSCKLKWEDPKYRQKIKEKTSTQEYKNKLRKHGEKFYKTTLKIWNDNPESSKITSKAIKLKWKDSKYREKQKLYYQSRCNLATKASLKKLSDPITKKKWKNKISQNSVKRLTENPRISLQQKQLYYLLKNSGYEIHEEGNNTQISNFYVVDCIVPKQKEMIKDIIIEVQGEYWHSLDHTIIKDKQKKTFIERHTNYDLLYLNELDFKCFDTLEKKLKSVNINIAPINCTVKDLLIKKISESQAQLFYETFHYSSTIRKGAITYGAYYKNNLVVAISYTYPIRLQIAKNLNCELKEIQEISRLAIASNLKCNNTASWFISKTIKLLPKEINTIISYSDSTYGHVGTVYKASNFINDKTIENNFHYENEFGHVFHKKTIWDRSKKFKMTIDQYANKHNLIKVNTKPKSRWVFKRK